MDRFRYYLSMGAFGVLIAMFLLGMLGQVPELEKVVSPLMNVVFVILGFLIACAVLAAPFYLVYILLMPEDEVVAKAAVKIKPPIKLVEVQEVLQKYSHYYRDLNERHKIHFVERLEIFLKMKNIIGRDFKINNELKILIASCAVQLTFGIDNFKLLSFRNILVYKETYYSTIRQAFHKGEVNVGRRHVILSATNFLEGISIPDDGINLGIHELTHALNIDSLLRDIDPSFIVRLNEWETIASREMKILKLNPNHFLRSYAATNMHEMLAVSTEYFFEKPVEFKEALPGLYDKMVHLYRQNPINRSDPKGL